MTQQHPPIHRLYRLSLLAALLVILLGGTILFSLSDTGRIPDASDPTGGSTADPAPSAAGRSDMELVQTLVRMLIAPDTFSDLYHEIPAVQREGVSEDAMFRYVEVLRGGIRGKVTGFTAMSAEEFESVRDEMAVNREVDPEEEGTLHGYWIVYVTSTSREERFSVFLHQDEDQRFVFSAAWIDAVLSLHSYADLYFDALASANTGALSMLVDSTLPDTPGTKEIRRGKADALIRFYRESIPGDYSGFRLLHARADSLLLEQGSVDYSRYLEYQPLMQSSREQPEVTPAPLPGPTPDTTRQVGLVRSETGEIRVLDAPPYEMAATDLVLYRGDLPVLGLGEYAYSFELNSRFGQRLNYTYRPARPPFDTDLKLIEVIHDNIRIVLLGVVDESTDAFSGNVLSMEWETGAYQTGRGVKVGNPAAWILETYPFADQKDWAVQAVGAYDRIVFTIENGTCRGMRIVRMPEELDRMLRTVPAEGPTS